MTPYEAVIAASDIYQERGGFQFSTYGTCGDWHFGIRVVTPGELAIAIRGSKTIQDFVMDADFEPIDAGQLGKVHRGFYDEAEEVFEYLKPSLVSGKKINFIGHSLGAPRAAYLAGLCAVNKIPVAGLFMFESPKPGYEELALQVHGYVPYIISTKNARDFVPDLPPSEPFPYVHICLQTDLMTPADSLNPIDDHEMTAIIAGVIKKWGKTFTSKLSAS